MKPTASYSPTGEGEDDHDHQVLSRGGHAQYFFWGISRLRFLQYLPYLESRGISVEHQALLDDVYLECIYSGRRPSLVRLVASLVDRLTALLRSSRFDLVWIEAELFPFLPALAERWLRVPYVVDYDDATFHRYDRHRKAAVRRLLGDKIDIVMRRATLVVAGNEYLADRKCRMRTAVPLKKDHLVVAVRTAHDTDV